jgi:hypothetical protein
MSLISPTRSKTVMFYFRRLRIAPISMAVCCAVLWLTPVGRGDMADAAIPPRACVASQMNLSISRTVLPNNPQGLIWYGTARYTNDGTTCELTGSTVALLVETGSAHDHRALSVAADPVSLNKSFSVRHGTSAIVSIWIVKKDQSLRHGVGKCSRVVSVTGLEVGGPSVVWPKQWFGLNPLGVCDQFSIGGGSGLLSPIS